MTYSPDLGTSTLIDEGDHVRAIGWLSATEPFTKGDVPPEFAQRLRLFCARSGASECELSWSFFMGWHDCEFCGRCMASGNLGVPAGDILFVAPEMVGHYVDVHHYRPPDVFIRAVLDSPVPGTPEYARAVAQFRQINLERQSGPTGNDSNS
jgi:hypothetical protein